MIRAFHIDTKFCPCRNEYVNYLASIESSDCIQCGTEAQIFSQAGRAPFRARRAARGPKGGRPRKDAPRATATARRAAA